MAHAAQHQAPAAAPLDRSKLEEIATREAHCKPFGETVTISREERDWLVGICRVVVEKFTSGNEIPVERITVSAAEIGKNMEKV